MKKNSGDTVWRSLLFNSFVVSGVLSFQCDRAFSQITPDDTLGDESSVVNTRDATNDSIDGGAIRGQNLFHSFEEFNVGEDRGVYFANPDDVTNIFSRVTGNNFSNILGTLGVDGAANLFLINPNGIVFGEGASLDVQGSFAATTADGIEFGDNGFFSAVNSQESVLTISVPLGLQFGSSPGSIINRSFVEDNTGDNVGLQVPAGENLTLVGGDVSFEAGEATARGGNIEIGGLSAAGEVAFNDDGGLSFPDNVARANISLSNAADVDVTGTGGGNIKINARSLNVEAGESGSSSIRAGITADSTSTEAQAGDITINATDNIVVDESIILNWVDFGAVGNGGSLIFTTSSLTLSNGGTFSTSTLGQGNAGSILINATDIITIDGETSFGSPSSATSQVSSEAVGNAGNIAIFTGSLALSNGGTVNASTLGRGNAGAVKINATDIITIDGETSDGNPTPSSANSQVNLGAFGDAGNVAIFTGSLALSNGGTVSASTLGRGNAGAVKINATDIITIDGETSDGIPSSATSRVDSEAVGDGGNVTITTDSLTLTNGGRIDASTLGQGNAGDLVINAMNAITIDGENSRGFASGATSGIDQGAVGDGGNIAITADSLTLTNRGRVETSTFGQGKGGELDIKVNSLNLNSNAFIFSRSETDFDAGDITLDIANSLQATNSSISTSSNQSSGGNLTIAAGDIRLSGNSDITTNIISGQGSGGNIAIEADSIIAFDDSDIFAFAADGQGGNITLDTPAYFAENFTVNSLTANPDDLDLNARADVNATGAVSGSVTIPDVSSIQNSLTELANDSLNTDELVANSCVVPVGDRKEGKFIITGTQSLPLRPGDGIPSQFPTGEVRSVPEKQSSWQPGDPIVEPQGAYRLANGKLVLSRECSK
jgi:filamentous hemagglutinin family protein